MTFSLKSGFSAGLTPLYHPNLAKVLIEESRKRKIYTVVTKSKPSGVSIENLNQKEMEGSLYKYDIIREEIIFGSLEDFRALMHEIYQLQPSFAEDSIFLQGERTPSDYLENMGRWGSVHIVYQRGNKDTIQQLTYDKV